MVWFDGAAVARDFDVDALCYELAGKWIDDADVYLETAHQIRKEGGALANGVAIGLSIRRRAEIKQRVRVDG